MAFTLKIKRLSDSDLVVGDLIYTDHTLQRITAIGRWRNTPGGRSCTYRFRVIGKINLDRQKRSGVSQGGGE